MRIVLICAAILALAGLLPAQVGSTPIAPGPPVTMPPSAPFPDLQKYLNLTDAQVAALVGIQQQQQQAFTQVYQQLSQKEQTLQTLLQASSPNALSIGQTMIDLQNLQKQVSQIGAEPYHTQALAVLNANQTALLANLTSALQLQNTAYQAVSAMLLLYPQSVGISILTPGKAISAPAIGAAFGPGGN
jgi:hypothetical protein